MKGPGSWYTAGSAYAQFREREVGTLEPGHWADFRVLAKDPTGVAPDEIAKIPVVMTAVGAEVVYRA